MKVLMLAPLHKEDFQKIEEDLPDVQFIYATRHTITQEMIDHCDVIVGNPGTHFDLNKSHLKAILLHSAGSDNYVKKGMLHPDTKLANASGTYGKAISEHVIGMILTLNKNLKQYIHHMDQHRWEVIPTGKEIYHSTVVIVGLGDLGYEIAKRLKAFDCHIIGIKRRLSPLPPHVDEIYTTDHLHDVLKKADFVISTLPQSQETIHIFNKEAFLCMKKDAVFVNVGRGSAVHTQDLISVLKQGHLYGVALDVCEQEPLDKNSELWDFDNVLITPHASGGYVWQSARHYYRELVIRNLQHLFNNESLENEVDFQTGYRKHIKYQ